MWALSPVETTRCFPSSPTIENDVISGNQAEFGGGIWVGNSSPTISGNTISNNQALNGGAISVSSDSTLILNEPDDNTYSGNQFSDIFYSAD